MQGLIQYNGDTSEGLRFWKYQGLVLLVNGLMIFGYVAAGALAWRIFS